MGTITVNGLGSGLTYDVWIEELVAVKQAKIDAVSKDISGIQTKETALSSLQTNFTTLQTRINNLGDIDSSNSTFNKKAATSSSEAVTASADSTATLQSVAITVQSLATATTAKATSNVASYVDTTTKMSEISGGTIKEGSFSVYVGGTKHTLTIGSDATVGSVLDSLNAIDGVDASLTNGKLTIAKDGVSTVTVGASSDTSNFSNVMSLTRDANTGTYSSSKSIFDTNPASTLTTAAFAAGSVTAGTFKIGNAEFTIDSTTTLNDIIAKINKDEDAGATAYWDTNSGKLVLTSTNQGATNLNIEAGTSNFTDVMGLTASGNIVQNAQTLGTNAVLTINGTSITSSSNTITSDISGIKGLTLNLKAPTTSTATVNIANDTSAAVDAITNIVSAYNMAISNTRSALSSDGKLYGQSLLSMIETSIRRNATAAVGFDNTYKTLASIGITTGAVGTDVKADTSQLKIDTEKLNAALKADPEAVKKLLFGNDNLKTNGIFSKIETNVDNSLDATSGYFVKQQDSFENQIKRLNAKVEKMTTKLTKYQEQLQTKFQAMDELISSLNNSKSVFDSYFNNKKSSDS